MSIASVSKLILLALRLCVIVICFIGDRFIYENTLSLKKSM